MHFYTLNRSLATQRIFARLQESSVAGLLPAHTAPSPSGKVTVRSSNKAFVGAE